MGRLVYRPVLDIGAPRFLPSPAEETAMRQAVLVFYRYLVLVVFPVIIFLLVGLPTFADLVSEMWGIDATDRLVRGAFCLGTGLVLILPAFIWIKARSRRYAEIDTETILIEPDPESGPTLGGTFLLVGLTMFVGLAAFAFLALLFLD